MSVEVPPSEWLRHERQGDPEDLAITGLGPRTGGANVPGTLVVFQFFTERVSIGMETGTIVERRSVD